jgi:hypothetical protein
VQLLSAAGFLTKVFTLIDNPLPFSEGLLIRPNGFGSQFFVLTE